jgi:streptogrisin C
MEDMGSCAYGRNTNVRNCDLIVIDVSTGCTKGAVTLNRTVMMNGIASDFGDSGGGWSVGGTAHGSIIGECPLNHVPQEVWSVADLYDEAVSIRVRCGC